MRKRTPSPFEYSLFICLVCAFQAKLLSMYIPRNLVEMEKGSVVLLIFIIGVDNFLTGMEKYSSIFANIYI